LTATSLRATSTGDGRIVVGAPVASGGALVEGPANGAFAAATALPGPVSAIALGRAYLGDVAVAWATPSGLSLRVQRHFERRFGRAIGISSRRGVVSALDVALDYRGDVLVTWEQNGSIWARTWRASGHRWPVQRLGSSASHPQLQAVISDDNRAIVTWASTKSGRTHIWISVSAPLVRFTARPKLIESFADATGLPDGALRMTRLSTERVLLLFTGKETDRHVVRAAAVSLEGLQPVATISDPATDSVLEDVATGPRADAVAVWKTASGAAGSELVAARGVVHGAQATFGPQEIVGRMTGDATVAIDPASDAALAAWQDGAAIETSARRAG
jgi:hypothetical protein